MDGMEYLPGMNPMEPTQFVSTDLKEELARSPGRFGCHPSRWIHELVTNDFTECDVFKRAERDEECPPFVWQHQHRLTMCGTQNVTHEAKGERLLSTVCLDCRYHLVFRMRWNTSDACTNCGGASAWPLPDNISPWHHLVWASGMDPGEVLRWTSKYYPLVAVEQFVCSAPSCTFELTLEISKPRLPQEFIDLIRDREAIKQALAAAKAADPVRHESLGQEVVTQGVPHLSTYIRNILEQPPGDKGRKISKGNKKFAVVFGPRCYKVFRFLEFGEDVLEEDGVDNGTFNPTAPQPANGPNGSTSLNTYRSFLQDVRSELQCIIHLSGHQEGPDAPFYASRELHAALGCMEVQGRGSPGATDDPHSYRFLGTLPGQSKEIVVNAYKRQWEASPKARATIVSSLRAVASHSGNQDLITYAMMQDSLWESQKPTAPATQESKEEALVHQAFLFFDLNPNQRGHTSTQILEAYRHKVATDPRLGPEAKARLETIAKASKEENTQLDLIMEVNATSLPTARRILMLEENQNTASEVRIAGGRWWDQHAYASDDMNAKETFIDALQVVTEHVGDPGLIQYLADKRKSTGVGSGRAQQTAAAEVPNDWDLPVGLDNIGNTCYLNSLLQYLYTIRVVRDIALNYDSFRLELTDEQIERRRLGGNKMPMDRGEAVVAQAFVKELGELFHNLMSSDKAATRPSQRLANAVLLATHSLLEAPTQKEAVKTPPPLPARPTSVAAAQDMDGAPGAPSRPWEINSDDSTTTLVGDDGDHPIGDAQASGNVAKPSEISPEFQLVSSTTPMDTDSAYDSHHESQGEHKSMNGGDAAMTGTGPEAQEWQSASARSEDRPPVDSERPETEVVEADQGPIPEPETVDDRVLKALEHQKRSSGTDQQDVEEVIGSILNRLQAAIVPIYEDDETGIQHDKIMKTFFVTTVNYTKKFEGAYQHEVSYDRSITAFPAAEGACSLYDALGRNFDQQILEESKLSRYTAIQQLPPILHVLIQRSQNIGQKNGNAVEIPETLYLDRYMDAEHDSPAFRKRVEGWSVAKRLEELKTMKEKIDHTANTGEMLEAISNKIQSGSHAEVIEESGVFDSENWDFDGIVEDDFVLVKPANDPGLAEAKPSTAVRQMPVEEMRRTEKDLQSLMAREMEEQSAKLERLHSELNQTPYRLHAVICHRGHLSSGHYWVWIHDFEEGVWRKYNDATVTVTKRGDTDGVLRELSTTGEPYYLCYVRDEDKEDWVSVVKRERKEEQHEEKGEGGQEGQEGKTKEAVEGPEEDGGSEKGRGQAGGEELIEVRVSPVREESPPVHVIGTGDVEMAE